MIVKEEFFETLFEMNIIESTEDGYKLNIEKE